MRRSITAALTAVAATAAFTLSAGPALAYPPDPPSAGTAATQLASLTVKTEGSTSGYSRDLFPHWITQSGSCDTREQVLKRDGTGVTVDSSCQPTTGRWYSVYDATYVNDSSGVDIDHIVPLAEAWKSGANGWSTARRQQFANDLSIAQLIAVSASSNRSKGDKDPSEWKPTNSSVHCIYAREWIWVKYTYGLSLQSAEKTALQQMLAAC
ncbi:HNH endonuclease [Kribbella pittospori]|uniref:HNH endonuclease n=1 Tax=Kribbella pittospori TaxID=722689 RepID=A0A4R0KKP5_9ACTN|nr:HNH endonuclease family protein [Kribbella pittospori]TCC61251.1 HNH endonuclease [Kribbella pittospori]